MELHQQGKPLRNALPLLLAATCSMDIEDVPLDQHQVKASFLFNLLRFIQWPDDPSGHNKSRKSLNLYICGAHSLSAFYALDGARVGTRSISVQRLKEKDLPTARPNNWHILIISGDVPIKSAPLAPGLLTIGETEWFTASCGIMSLMLIDGRVRFQINEEVAQACGLVINPRLLRLRMR